MIVATRYVIMLPNFIGRVSDAVDHPCSVFINSGVNLIAFACNKQAY